ncbi:MAG: ABC transporter ATP-binding protein [Clostridiales bacterium]|nr:ABC transporter ATP-binding protein [Clostridiales bacterium]
MSVIEISGLTRDYGNGKGVFDVSFAVEQGEVFGFLGPNGAGKTTTIRHLMGFLQPKTGSCKIGGRDCFKAADKVQASLGYIPGEIAIFDDMTGTEYLSFAAKYRGLKDGARKKELIERFELDPRGKLKKMSKGMKQKVGIVAAFMHDPEVLILDEPTSGLDPLMQNRFIELIDGERSRGKTVLMSSHMFEEVERTCHRVGIIRNGRLAAIDSVSALKAAQLKKYAVTFESETAAAAFLKEPFSCVGYAGNAVTATVQNDITAFIAALNKYPVVNLSAPALSLEEIFMKYYGGNGNV